MRATLYTAIARLEDPVDLQDGFIGVDVNGDGVPDIQIDQDQDKNGVTDIQDLRMGHNPFLPNDPDLCAAGPAYGCGATIAPEPKRAEWPLGLTLLTALGLALRITGRGRVGPRRA